MFGLPQRPSPLALLGAAAVAAGLSIAVLYTVPWDLMGSGGGEWQEGTLQSAGGKKGHAPAFQPGASKNGGQASTNDGSADDLLPQGVSHVEGRGGQGVHRAVLKDGVWIPVFSPGDALRGDDPVPQSSVTVVPLSITSGSPPAGKTGTTFAYDFEAIGGTPPYQWRYQLAERGEAFTMDAASGLLAGVTQEPLETVLEVYVIDATGDRDSARYPLVIEKVEPLTIKTTSLVTANVNSAYVTQLTAAGGKPPYFWTVTGLESTGLTLTANTGELTGVPEVMGEHPLQVTVTDQEDAVVDSALTLTVAEAPAEETSEETEVGALQIKTVTLPDAVVGMVYQATLTAQGGTAPYTWALTGALPEGLTFDPNTATFGGTPVNAGEAMLQMTVMDQEGQQAAMMLRLRTVNGLEITTASPLLPGSPGLPYTMTFMATGGVEPYQWRLREGLLPYNGGGVSWLLSPQGMLSGVAAPAEGQFRFSLEVQDASGRTATKTFELAIQQTLIAVPSREKAGLAWRTDRIAGALSNSGSQLAFVTLVRGVGGFPQTPAAGAMVYQGLGTNTVDHGLPTGGTFFYTLFAQTIDGRTLPYGTTVAKILPMTLQRAVPGVTGDPYADRVPEFRPLRAGGYGSSFVPGNITGPPDGKNTLIPASQATEVASLHAQTGAGGYAVLEFTDNIVELGPGADLTVFENVFFVGGDANNRFMEPAVVWVALFEGEWYRFPIDVVPPAAGQPLKLNDPFYYNRGFAGRNPTTGSNPTDPTASGGDSFDANQLGIPGLTWIRYVKIQSAGDNAWVDDFGGDPVRHPSENGALSGSGTSGFDLDAVSAVNY